MTVDPPNNRPLSCNKIRGRRGAEEEKSYDRKIKENKAQRANDASLSNGSDLSLTIYSYLSWKTFNMVVDCRRGIQDITVKPFNVVQYHISLIYLYFFLFHLGTLKKLVTDGQTHTLI